MAKHFRARWEDGKGEYLEYTVLVEDLGGGNVRLSFKGSVSSGLKIKVLNHAVQVKCDFADDNAITQAIRDELAKHHPKMNFKITRTK
jgi:hypothetical protein